MHCRYEIIFLALIGCGQGAIEPASSRWTDGSAGANATGGGGSGPKTGSATTSSSTSAGGAGGGTSSSGSGGAPGSTGGSVGVGSGGASIGSGGTSQGVGGGGASVGSGGSSIAGGGSAGTGGGAGGAGGAPAARAWRPFSDSSPWNTPIPQAPGIDPNSVALIADLAASTPSSSFWVNVQNYSIPVFWVDATTPRQNVSVTLLAGQGFGNGSTGSALVPIPAGATPAAGTDRHLCIIDKQAHTEWGMWDASNGGGWTASVAATADLSGTGVRPPKANNPTWWTSHGARACGFPLSAGLITVEEIRKGKIEHALVIAYPHMRSHWYEAPASTAQVTTNLAIPTRGVPCGGRIQLDPAVDVNSLSLSASGKIIARALQEYGAFVGDFSGAISLYADASPDALAAWNGGLLKNDELGSLDLKKLRVLTIGSMFEDDN